MIARLRGEVVEVGSDHVVIDTGGVGYLAYVPGRSLREISAGDEINLSVSTQVREDAINLYGFTDTHDRLAFEKLIGVSGVGPRLALAALSAFSLPDLVRAIEAGDVRSLCGISGVGKKTAQRLALELKGKIDVPFTPAGADGAVARPRVKASDPLVLALARLGYRKTEIDQAIAGLSDAGLTEAPVAARLSASLKILSGRSV